MKTPPAASKPAPRPRKNARRYDLDPTDKNGTVLSTRVSHEMKKRTMEAARALGCSNHSEIVCFALVRLFNQLPEIIRAYEKNGVLPMNLAAMKDFRALALAPEEIAYAKMWVPEKVERLDAKRLQIEHLLNDLLGRVAEVERMLKIERLEQPSEEPLPMRVEVDLI
jgi:hypothetical protein